MMNSVCKLVHGGSHKSHHASLWRVYCLRPRMLWSVGYGGWAGTEVTCKSVWTSAKTIVFRSNMHNNPLSFSLSTRVLLSSSSCDGSQARPETSACHAAARSFVRRLGHSFDLLFILYSVFHTLFKCNI